MIDEKWTGATSEVVKITVTREMIASYAKAIHHDNSIYVDIDSAKRAGYQDIPAPPTMPIIFWSFIKVPWLEDVGPVIHGKQCFSYEHPVVANRTYDCVIHLKDVRKRQNNCEIMQRSNHELLISFNDCIHASIRTTLLIFKK
ncbi:MaoC family dehydratase N-terminal domain-containing protein [Halalkalibacter kiskunsagensis]|uniref:MaoC family dehydratase N-terminal domain-containing protein n=1 Tax=Halalkalibacter kiskunsagensis TaxID=1548599 RepID=A0ABV6KC61_9BACI